MPKALRFVAAGLNHLIELRGIGLITGESGSGKTTVCRKVLSGLHAGVYRVVYVQHSTGNVMNTYKTIAWELGLSVERSRVRSAASKRFVRIPASLARP